jgi:hypothetical protein
MVDPSVLLAARVGSASATDISQVLSALGSGNS